MIYTLVPWYSPIAGQVDLLKLDDVEMESWKKAHIEELTKLNTIVFRLCKMIDLKAAPEPNITDLTLHLSKGLKKMSKYGVTTDNSKRMLQKALELGTTTVITSAVFKAFSGAWSPTIKSYTDTLTGKTKVDRLPWTEDYMKKLRYHLFMTEDQKMMVLSQTYRYAFFNCNWTSATNSLLLYIQTNPR